MNIKINSQASILKLRRIIKIKDVEIELLKKEIEELKNKKKVSLKDSATLS
tara:strand:- start:189 stop:341 length:153 start_codon:yes stop_codon:yes gene_type:complete